MNRKSIALQDRRDVAAKLVVPLRTTQFSIRTLMILTALVALGILVLQELAERFGLIAVFVAVLGGLSVFAHVAGAALGNRFRNRSGATTANTESLDDQHLADLNIEYRARSEEGRSSRSRIEP